MKSIKKITTSIASVFIILMMLQSCTVYNRASSSLDKAVLNKSKVKIITTNNDKIKLNYIKSENEAYYGVDKVKGKYVNIPIDETKIISVHEKNKAKSTGATILTSLGIAGAIYVIVVISIIKGIDEAFDNVELD